MASFRVALFLSGAILASTAAQAQLYQQDRAQTLGQSYYAPSDNRAAPAQPQTYTPQEFRTAPQVNGYGAPTQATPADVRSQVLEHRGQIPDPRQIDARLPDPRTQQPAYRAPTPDYRQQMPEYRNAVSNQELRNAPPLRGAAPAQDPRAGFADNARNVQPAAPPRAIQLLVAPQPAPNYIDYKSADGRPYDYRPADYKPVDTRAMDYRSEDNKGQDQKILDPRLREKGPEILTRIDCKAIIYRAVECNYLDYREVDPKMQELLAKFPEISLGIVPAEYTKEAIDRWTPLITYLSKEIGLKISLKIANDYQALIESQKAGLIHIAIYNQLSFARARASGAKVDAFAVETNNDGSKGQHSVIYTMARGVAPRMEDLKGKTIGLVDPNSMSGYNMPRFALASQKIDPDQLLGRQVFTGSHENALMALSQGLVDLAVGQWSSDEDSTLQRLLAKNQLKNVDGTPMRRDDFRVVVKSDMILNSPIAYLSELPEDVKAMIRRAMLEAPLRDRAAFERVYDSKGRTWDIIDSKTYDGTVELLRFMDESKRLQQAAFGKQAMR